MSETVRQVVATVVANRERFEAFCRSLSDEQLARPVPGSDWIVRDFAAHLGSLDAEFERWFSAVAAGDTLDSSRAVDGAAFDIDQYNDAAVAERRAWPFERVLAEAAELRDRMLRALGALTDEQVARTMHFAADRKRKAVDLPLKAFLVGWAQHDPIHAADMLKALPERAADAELREWLANPCVVGYQAAMNAPR